MDVTQIPFAVTTGISKTANGELQLHYTDSVLNHLQTIHASAQFTLAETASGELLLNLFPELADRVIPILRDACIKYKKPATKNIIAYPSIHQDNADKFKQQFNNKGRGSITVNVTLKDSDDTLVCSAEFNWFVQEIE